MKRRAFTLTELIIASSMMVLVIGLLFSVSLHASRVAIKVSDDSQTLYKMRGAFERIASDLQSADAVLAKYPATTPTYRSATRDTIILRIPKYDSTGVNLTGDFDVVVYHVQNPEQVASGIDTAGRYTLTRQMATISASGTEGSLSNPTIMCTTVVQLSFAYGAVDQFRGDGWTTSFGLRTNPLAGNEYFPKEVNIAGVDWAAEGFAIFTGTQVEFQRAPKSGIPIDVIYPIDPTISAQSNGGNAADVVNVKLRARNISKSANNTERTRDVEFQTQVELRNYE